MARTSRLSVCIETATRNASHSQWPRSHSRQRTTPWIAGIGPWSICAATHETKPVRDWLAKRPRWHVHFTPTGASWINQVERFFAELTEQQIRSGVQRSTAQLGTEIRAFIDTRNVQPKPFRRTKSADDILAAIQRICRRTQQIGGTTEPGH
jgi:transposase